MTKLGDLEILGVPLGPSDLVACPCIQCRILFVRAHAQHGKQHVVFARGAASLAPSADDPAVPKLGAYVIVPRPDV